METPFKRYINSLRECYLDEYEDTSLISKMVDSFAEYEKEGLKEDDAMLVYIFNNKQFIFQNPVITDIVKEIKNDEKYKEYLTKPSLKGFLIGRILKKYPSCYIERVEKLAF